MKIGGFIPFSLCEFPGRVAAVVFTQGCNFRCPFCHNGRLITHVFRTTAVGKLLSDGDMNAIRTMVPKGSKHEVQMFDPQHALDPALSG